MQKAIRLGRGWGKRSRHNYPPKAITGPKPKHECFLESFGIEVPGLDPDRFAEVCQRDERVNIQVRPYGRSGQQ